MKSRTKSTRQSIPIGAKSRKVSEEPPKNKKTCKKDQTETRKYLLKTLSLLQQRFKLDKVEKKGTNSHLSASVYDIVKNNLPIAHTFSKSQLQEYTSSMQLQRDSKPLVDINKSTASLMNLSVIHGKRRSNSALDEYFKQKFGSPAKDQETIQKKLRVLKALKKSQQIVTKVSQNTRSMRQKDNQILGDVDNKMLIVDKLRPRKAK